MTTIRTLSLGLAIVAAGAGLARAQRPGQELRDLFGKLDANNDKVVERSEVPARAMPAFEKLLGLADSNKDGKLEAAEMRELLKGMGPAAGPAPGDAPATDPSARFKAADKDGDGKISKAEFPGQPAAFDRLDANKDGFLDKDEAKTLGVGGGAGAGGGVLGAPVMAMDKDGDGKVSRAEFTGQPAVFDALDVDKDGQVNKAEAAKAPQVRAQLIRGLDADGDQKISRDEWKGQPAAFDRLDTNKDGFISFDELRDAAQGTTPKAETPAKKAATKKKA